jgi:hypothetical protein
MQIKGSKGFMERGDIEIERFRRSGGSRFGPRDADRSPT